MLYDRYDSYDDKDEDEQDEVEEETKKKSNYLGIMFNCCNTYGRIYKNRQGTAYVGRCPRCLRSVKVNIGEGGTNRRFFNAY